MPKAKRLNGVWGGRSRRALGAAVIAMVLVFNEEIGRASCRERV